MTQALDTTTVVQVAIVVDDIETKAQAWANILGLPVPDLIIGGTVDKANAEYKGESTRVRAKFALFNLGQVALELIEPIDGPSTWKDQLDQHGSSLHHIAFRIKGMSEKVAYLASQGVPLIQRGDYTGGRYAYLDGVEKLGLILELLEND